MCVKIQYISCIYLWGIISIFKNKFTVKHFATLPPMWKLSCQKSSFDCGLIFSNLPLLILQKHFFSAKIQYLMSTYVWLILFKWVELPSGWVVPGSCVKIFFGFWSVNFCFGGLFRWTILTQKVHLGRSTMPGWYKACQIGKTLYWYLFIKKNDKVTILAEIAIFSIFSIEGKYKNFQIWMQNYFAQLKIINLQTK